MRVSPRRRTGWPCPHQAEWSAFEVDPNRETTVRTTRAGGAWIRRRRVWYRPAKPDAEYVSKVDADAEHTNGPSRVIRPRIFLGSSGKQAKLLQAITRGLADVADVEPWTTTFNPGRSTLDRLVELSQEVDFAAFVFAEDDWTTTDASRPGTRPRATTWCSRPGCSAARSVSAARSSSTRAARSSRPTCSG